MATDATITTLEGRILTPAGWVRGRLRCGAAIHAIEEDPSADDRRLILPGFIDLHVHGAGGVDIMEGGGAARAVARLHARHGSTTILATTMTAPPDAIEHALRGIRAAMDAAEDSSNDAPEGAQIAGVHLEGPFLNLHRLGAQPPQVATGTLEQVRRWHAIAPIRALTLAPEIPGHLELIPQLSALGIRVQAGHSAGTYEDGVAAIEAGLAGFTHLFNGMTGLNHYTPGIVGAALAHGEYAEIIPDLQHVRPGAILAAMRAIPRLYAVTDATSATGMPDGQYMLGSQLVAKCRGCVRLVHGDSLAGSALTMDQALRNLTAIGLSLADASDRVSRFPAGYLGLQDRGVIAPGKRADLVVLNNELQVRAVLLAGRSLNLAEGEHHAPVHA